MRSHLMSIGFLSCLIFDALGFTHPGLLHTSDDFDRISEKVNAADEPWLTGWYKLTNNSHATSTYVASPQAMIYRGVSTDYTENYPDLYNDAAAAYALAVRWKVSNETAYADTAVDILNQWAQTLTTINGTGDKYLASGIYGYQLANAAEIVRDYSGWDIGSFYNLVNMLRTVFYPMNHDFLVNHADTAADYCWANWDLANIATMQAIGILSENYTMYNEAVDYFKYTGEGNGRLNKTLWALITEDGSDKTLAQGQEAGRDQGHATLDFSLLGVIAQQSYNQGDDLFAYLDNRILAGIEYAAKYNLGCDVPYTTYTNTDIDVSQTVISSSYRGTIRPMGELLYAHYSSLKGLNASWTGEYRDLVVTNSSGAEGGGGDYGPNSGGYDQLGYGTLLYRLEA